MCRWIAYKGKPIYLDALVATPERSLIAQSMCAAEAKVTTNGDGFGVGWYGARDLPGLYREVRPAWSDENLRSLCYQVSSSLFFAHVRASTGPATARANCHPFAVGRWMFMHNGQVGNYCAVKRRLDAMIPTRSIRIAPAPRIRRPCSWPPSAWGSRPIPSAPSSPRWRRCTG